VIAINRINSVLKITFDGVTMMISISGIKVFTGSKKVLLNELPVNKEIIEKSSNSLGMYKTYIEDKLTLRDMVVKVANDLLVEKAVDRQAIDVVIYTSGLNKDFTSWCGAAYIQKECKLSNAYGFDIYQGCNSSLQAVIQANNILKANDYYNKVLVVGGDKVSKNVENCMISTILGGDGAYALLVERSEEGFNIVNSISITDGRFANFTYALGGVESNITEEILLDKLNLYQVRDKNLGQYVEDACVDNFISTIKRLLEKNKLKSNEINYYVFPNTNKGLYLKILDNLNIPLDKGDFDNIKNYGHLGCTDFALNIKKLCDSVKTGEKIVASSMGVGLSWSSVLFSYL